MKQDCTRRFFRLPQTAEARLAALAAADPAAALPEVRKAVHASPRNWRLLLLYAGLCRILNRRRDFQHAIEQIRLPSPASVLFRAPLSAPAFLRFPLPVPSALKADFLLLSALGELYQTDMYSASAHCSRALRLYQKNGFAWEEAECYMALAQIYRISGVFDVAFTMLREAKKSGRNSASAPNRPKPKPTSGWRKSGAKTTPPLKNTSPPPPGYARNTIFSKRRRY